MSISEYEKLRKKLEEMERDPIISEQLQSRRELESELEVLGFTPEDAARLLVPTAHAGRPEQPLLTDRGARRLPNRPDKKIALHAELLEARKQIDLRIQRLEDDPAMSDRKRLIEMVSNLDLTPEQAAELLAPDINRAPPKTRQSSGQRAKRYWRNPNTGEVVSGRSSNIIALKKWSDEHGKSIVKNWEITPEEAEAAENR